MHEWVHDGSPKGEERKKGAEEIMEETMSENSQIG
jgi:hypothetical protein